MLKIKLVLMLLLDLVIFYLLQSYFTKYLFVVFLVFNVQILSYLFTEFVYYLKISKNYLFLNLL